MPNSAPDSDYTSPNETAESNTSSRTGLSDERLKSKTDPFMGTPEADLLNVSGSGPRSTDVEPGADPKIKEGKLRMMDEQTANLETSVLTQGLQDLPGKDPPLTEVKAAVEPVTEENKPEVVHEQTADLETGVPAPGLQDLPGKDPSSTEVKAEVEPVTEDDKPEVVNEAEPSDEVSDSCSETEKTSPLPKSKEKSTNASEQEPQCTVQDSLEDIPSHFPPVAFRSSTPIKAMKALEAECEAPPLIGNEAPKAGQEQNGDPDEEKNNIQEQGEETLNENIKNETISQKDPNADNTEKTQTINMDHKNKLWRTTDIIVKEFYDILLEHEEDFHKPKKVPKSPKSPELPVTKKIPEPTSKDLHHVSSKVVDHYKNIIQKALETAQNLTIIPPQKKKKKT